VLESLRHARIGTQPLQLRELVSRPLAELDPRPVRAVLVDIDETLTTAGKLTAQAYAALERLQHSGRIVVPVTGRPAGWCDHIARMWPVDAVVGENGAFYFWFAQGKLHKRFVDDDAARARKRALLGAIADRILRAVPGSALASDQSYRETDLAIDFCEDVPPLPLEAADRIASLMREAGLTAKISSIHVNGWFGDYDKLATTRRFFSERFAIDIDAANRSIAFAGDSPNDAPMFAFFENSVGVANVRRFAGLQPRFVTLSESGAGFAELATHLLRQP
jgi:HAD superfamily hydrolase (TIGR01484 family)